jgi:hypothetical protein
LRVSTLTKFVKSESISRMPCRLAKIFLKAHAGDSSTRNEGAWRRRRQGLPTLTAVDLTGFWPSASNDRIDRRHAVTRVHRGRRSRIFHCGLATGSAGQRAVSLGNRSIDSRISWSGRSCQSLFRQITASEIAESNAFGELTKA